MSKKLPVFILLCFCFFLNQVQAQTLMPIPAHGSVYTGSARGYWFTAPTNFIITGLRVPIEAGTGLQYIHVMKCNTPFPVAFGSQSTNFTTLQYISGAPNNVVQTVNISVNAGDVIGILGTAGTSNSYSASAVITSTILGFPVTLTRFGYQGNINTAPAPSYWGEALGSSAQISRVEMYYGSAVVTAPSCVATPLTPANNSTTVCSGSTVLRWNKAAGATGYDVYLNTGTGTPATLVSSNQPDTFYNATTVPGPYRWRVVPKNTVGAATGCTNWAFTTVPGITPTVSFAVGPNDTICAGTTATFTASAANEGTNPVYQWKKNNNNVGTNSAVYVDANLGNNDHIKLVLTSSMTGCVSSPTVTSDSLRMTIVTAPAITITAGGPLEFCAGGSVRLNAPTGGLSYQWLQANVPIAGATNASYNTGFSGYYRVRMTTSSLCPSFSDSLKVTAFQSPFPLVNRNGNILSTATFYTGYQWYFNSQAIPGATASTYTATRDGRYKVAVTDISSCSGVSVDLIINSLDIPAISGAAISVYPNPASSTIAINSPVTVNIALRSMEGKLVLAQNKATTIDISKVASGIYFLHITDINGQVLKVEKIVKRSE
jgi:hypothetical protein